MAFTHFQHTHTHTRMHRHSIHTYTNFLSYTHTHTQTFLTSVIVAQDARKISKYTEGEAGAPKPTNAGFVCVCVCLCVCVWGGGVIGDGAPRGEVLRWVSDCFLFV